jgi:hypothetical protein
MAHRFEPALLWALVRSVGYYPAGQLVVLDDGYIATALAPNADDPARPHVRVILSAIGVRLAQDKQVEYRPLPPERRVLRALKIAEYPEGIGNSEDGAQQAA